MAKQFVMYFVSSDFPFFFFFFVLFISGSHQSSLSTRVCVEMVHYPRYILHFLFLCAISLVASQIVAGSTSQAVFTRRPVCDLNRSCFNQYATARSKLECISLCLKNTRCENIFYVASSNTCYDITGCDVDATCVTFHPGVFSYQREDGSQITCLHGGQLDSNTGKCDCTNTAGYAGDHCDLLVQTCSDLAKDPNKIGDFPIMMDLFGDGSTLVQTHCVLTSFARSFTFMRSSGTVGKSLSWEDYVNGFRFSDEDYWIGLEHLHRYTSRATNVRARLGVTFNSSVAQGEILESTNDFTVGPASAGYAYTIDTNFKIKRGLFLSGVHQYTAFDNFLLSHVGKPFSTADNDQDGDGQRNCAELAGAGWWFGSCDPFTANPLGWSYTALPGPTTDSHIRLPGVDMSRSDLAKGFQHVFMAIDEITY